MAYLMPTTKGHVFWISQTNGANLSRITKKEHYMLGDVTKSWYFLSKMETKKLYKNKVSKYLGKMDEYPIIMSRTLKRWRADSWIIWRISWCILLKTAWAVRLYAAAIRNSSIDWRRKRVSIWSTSHLSTTFHENTKNNELLTNLKAKQSTSKDWVLRFGYYPNIPSSNVALYWEGISIKADRANSVCFLIVFTFFVIISVKFTNYKHNQKQCFSIKHTLEAMI